MESLRNVLIGAKELIEKTNWCQGQYALKNGKPYNYTSTELADSYCLLGAIHKVVYDFRIAAGNLTHSEQIPYTILAHKAAELVVRLQGWNDNISGWNDQDSEKEMLEQFIIELKKNNTPRDKAKIEINEFKQELKRRNIQPIVTRERVLAAIELAIASLS